MRKRYGSWTPTSSALAARASVHARVAFVALACAILGAERGAQNSSSLRADGAVDETSLRRVFLEWDVARTDFVVHEPIAIALVIGIDAEFLAERMIQPFRRPLDLPLQVRADWLAEFAGTIRIEADSNASSGPTLALENDIVPTTRRDDRVIEGRVFAVVELGKVILAREPGTLALPAPTVSYAYGTNFGEDPFTGRHALDRTDAVALGSPLILEVRPLPEEGRPPGFRDAVGNFKVSAEAEPRNLVAGETVRLFLHVEGTGNLSALEAPLLERFDDFDLLGQVEEASRERRTFVYELAPRRTGPIEIPPITFAFFDPAPPAGYRVLETHSIPLLVRERAPASSSAPDESVRAPAVSDERAAWIAPAAFAALVVLSALWVLRLRRRRESAGHRPGKEARDAVATFHATLAASGDGELADAFSLCVAALLGSPIENVHAPELASRLHGIGLSSELARRVHAQLEHLDGLRFGGSLSAASAAETRRIADELERWIRST